MTGLSILLSYLAIVLGLGLVSWRLSRGTSTDYLLASHSIGPFLLLMSLFGTTMTAFALVGSTGRSFVVGIGVYGLMGSSSGIVHSLCFYFLGTKLWSLGKRHGYRTQIDFFRDRLASKHIGLLLFPILIGLIIPYLLIGVMSAGTVMNQVSQGAFNNLFEGYGHGVPPWLGSAIISAVVLMYVFVGGMRGTAWANALQTSVFLLLGVVTFVVIANRLGSKDSLIANLQQATAMVAERNPSKLTRALMDPWEFASYMLIPLSAGMFPHLFQHWLTAKSVSSFKLAVVVHPIFIIIVWVPCVLVGVWATSAVVDGELLVPEGINPNAVLPFMVSRLSGPFLSGLLSAGILAAIMSSMDSQFLCIGTMFTNDVVVRYWGRNRLSDRGVVWLARAFITAIVVGTYFLSLLEPRAVFDLGIWCFSGFSSLVPLAFAAIYWRRLTAAGAYASILTMAVSWCYFFVDSDYAANHSYSFLNMLPVATIFTLSTISLVGFSLISRPPPDSVLARFFTESDDRKEISA